MKSALNVAAHCTQRGEETGDERSDERESDEASNHAPVNVDCVGERQLAMDLTPEQLDGGLREQEAEDTADAAEEQAFDGCLLQQAQAAGTESRAHRLLTGARHGTRQHEAGEVEAGQGPDAEDDRIEQHERLAGVVAERLLVTGDGNACGNAFIVGHFFGDDGLGAAESGG